jgi:hypothetical protein
MTGHVSGYRIMVPAGPWRECAEVRENTERNLLASVLHRPQTHQHIPVGDVTTLPPMFTRQVKTHDRPSWAPADDGCTEWWIDEGCDEADADTVWLTMEVPCGPPD